MAPAILVWDNKTETLSTVTDSTVLYFKHKLPTFVDILRTGYLIFDDQGGLIFAQSYFFPPPNTVWFFSVSQRIRTIFSARMHLYTPKNDQIDATW